MKNIAKSYITEHGTFHVGDVLYAQYKSRTTDEDKFILIMILGISESDRYNNSKSYVQFLSLWSNAENTSWASGKTLTVIQDNVTQFKLFSEITKEEAKAASVIQAKSFA